MRIPSPLKIYVKALIGYPSLGSPRDCPSNNVNSEVSVLIDNLSIQEGNNTNKNSYPNKDRESIPTITGTYKNTTKDRQGWTKEEQVDLFRYYCEAIKKRMPVPSKSGGRNNR